MAVSHGKRGSGNHGMNYAWFGERGSMGFNVLFTFKKQRLPHIQVNAVLSEQQSEAHFLRLLQPCSHLLI